MLLGFSTGAMFRQIPSVSKEIIDICREIGCNTIELSAKTDEEVALLKGLIESRESLAGFEYVSLHTCPGYGVMYQKDAKSVEILEKLQKAYDRFGCKCLVVHPSEVEDWSVFEKFSFKLAVENMSLDNPSVFFLPEHLESIFEKNKDYKMTFDVKHAFESGGKKLAEDLYETFKDKIVEIHLSGYNPRATKHEHRPLIETRQTEILDFVKDKQHLPIIIESDCESAGQMKTEFEYIKESLKD
jgi:sugar phosphate isomerase/epimerase